MDEEGGSVRVLTQTAQAPHNAVKAEELSIFVGARCLLENTELKIAEQTRVSTSSELKAGTAYGLVGQNGCGKSTLLRLIAEGRVPVPEAWDVLLVSQHLPRASDRCVLDEVLAAHAARAKLLEQQDSLEQEMAAIAEGDAQCFAAAEALWRQVRSELTRFDSAETDVSEILVALGFNSQARDSVPGLSTAMKQLSGGWRMKVELAKALWLQPRLLLLDEPSNHLDFHALQWLEEKIADYPHTAVVVSHDVSLLHGACQEILWIRDRKLESLPRDVVSQDDLVRMQRSRPLKFQFSVPEGEDPLSHGLSLHGIEFSYPSKDERPLSFRVKGDVRLSGKSRAVLLGKNGSGKSTFLDLCVGKLAPSRGTVDRTPDLQIGHYSQLTDELDRCSELTAADFLLQQCREALSARLGSTRASRLRTALAKETSERDTEKAKSKSKAADKRLLEVARAVLSNFGFDSDVAVQVPVDRLSGGQKACLKFAVLSMRPAHLLLLDEPTNHLDADACKALAEGLAEFKGGIVAVTHDELLIYRLIHCNWTASELLLCQDGCLWRERNFSAQCLKSIKQEVRKAEELEKAAGRSQQAPLRAKAASLEKAQELPGEGVQLTGPCPPWLLGRARRERKAPADEAKAVEQTEAVSLPGQVAAAQVVELKAGKVQEVKPSAWGRRPAPAPGPVPPAPVATEAVPAPDSWEDLEDDSPIEASACDKVPTSQEPARHSRFRKDLVNLNKAAAKWLLQEMRGELLKEEVLDRICSSTAAEKLRALHGPSFDERRFADGVLTKALKVQREAGLLLS